MVETELTILWIAVILMGISLVAVNMVWAFVLKGKWNAVLSQIMDSLNGLLCHSVESCKSDEFPKDDIENDGKEGMVPSLTDQGKGIEALLTSQAYSKYYVNYQRIVQNLSVENYSEESDKLGDLLVEMGLWLKDYLAVVSGDFNVTQAQRSNVQTVSESSGDNSDREETFRIPNNNPYETPLEVIALVEKFKKMGIHNINVSLSGYQYRY